MWTRTGKSGEKKIMVSNDWYLIDSLIQDIKIVKQGLASSKFITNLRKRLIESCDTEETIKALESID